MDITYKCQTLTEVNNFLNYILEITQASFNITQVDSEFSVTATLGGGGVRSIFDDIVVSDAMLFIEEALEESEIIHWGCNIGKVIIDGVELDKESYLFWFNLDVSVEHLASVLGAMTTHKSDCDNIIQYLGFVSRFTSGETINKIKSLQNIFEEDIRKHKYWDII